MPVAIIGTTDLAALSRGYSTALLPGSALLAAGIRNTVLTRKSTVEP